MPSAGNSSGLTTRTEFEEEAAAMPKPWLAARPWVASVAMPGLSGTVVTVERQRQTESGVGLLEALAAVAVSGQGKEGVTQQRHLACSSQEAKAVRRLDPTAAEDVEAVAFLTGWG